MRMEKKGERMKKRNQAKQTSGRTRVIKGGEKERERETFNNHSDSF